MNRCLQTNGVGSVTLAKKTDGVGSWTNNEIGSLERRAQSEKSLDMGEITSAHSPLFFLNAYSSFFQSSSDHKNSMNKRVSIQS